MTIQEVKVFVEDFIKEMGFEGVAEVSCDANNTFFVRLESPQSRFLIGKNGEVLMDFQALLNKIMRRKTTDAIFVDLDVNDYKWHKNKYLKDTAHNLAYQVALTKQPKQVDSLSPYERRVIHMQLKDDPHVSTESLGEEPNRYLVIKPKDI